MQEDRGLEENQERLRSLEDAGSRPRGSFTLLLFAERPLLPRHQTHPEADPNYSLGSSATNSLTSIKERRVKLGWEHCAGNLIWKILLL